MTKDEILEAVRNMDVSEFMEPARKSGFVCPACGNGTGANGTGIAAHTRKGDKWPHYKCFRCGEYMDAIDIYWLTKHDGQNVKMTGADFIATVEEMAGLMGLETGGIFRGQSQQKTSRRYGMGKVKA